MCHSRPTVASIKARLPRVLVLPAAALATGALLAACGGSDSPSSAAANERAQEQKAEAQLADLARCLREHGVKAETANVPGGGHGLKVGGPGGPGAGRETMNAAQTACARYRPRPKRVNLSPQQKVEQEEAVQKFAKCMREHGIQVEASAKDGSIRIGIHGGPGSGGPNPESPGFREAQNTCQKLLPRKGGGKGGPFPGGASRTESGAVGG